MLRGLLARLWPSVGGDDTGDTDGVDGSGAEHRDPAYNGRYEAEREVDRIAEEAQRIEDESEFDPERR